MPWMIVEEGEQYCVHKERADGSAGERVACHDTRAEAEAQMRALYASEEAPEKHYAVKATGQYTIGGYGARYTEPTDKDLQGDYFAPETDFWLKHYPQVPVLYNHGQDGALGKRVIGKAVPRRDEQGVWYEAQLEQRDEYEPLIMELVKAGALGYSTGSLSHLVERAPDGKLLSWPVAELTLTPTPAAGPYLTSVEAVRSAYKGAGMDYPSKSQGEEKMDGERQEGQEQDLTSDVVKSMIDDAVGSIEPPAGPDEAQIKQMIDAALEPYTKPQTKASPTRQPDEKADALKAFNVYLHTGKSVKALEEGTVGEGGYLVPEQYHPMSALVA